MYEATVKLIERILGMSRRGKALFVLIFEVSNCFVATFLAYFIKYESISAVLNSSHILGGLWVVLLVSPLVLVPLILLSGTHQTITRFQVTKGNTRRAVYFTIYLVLSSTLFGIGFFENVPRSIGLIQSLILIVTSSVARSLFGQLTVLVKKSKNSSSDSSSIAIWGAGPSIPAIVNALTAHTAHSICAIFDDDRSYLHGKIGMHRVIGTNEFLRDFPPSSVNYILVSSDGRSGSRLGLIRRFRELGYEIRNVPDLLEFAVSNTTKSGERLLEDTELLMREAVAVEIPNISIDVSNNVFAITGAGGTIGKGITKKLLTLSPKKLILIDISEFALYRLSQELQDIGFGRGIDLEYVLGDVRDESLLSELCARNKIDTIYHVAAYKHVPIVEENIISGVLNNIFGTLKVANTFGKNGVTRFVLVSSDKAVRPTNIMGASKRVSELLVQSIAELYPDTCFSIVRFGNVLNSSGSVVPLFQKQILSGGPVTVTHPEVTRYFMTIEEACDLVIHASYLSDGGEVYILDMGVQIKIDDLAKRMIELHGRTVATETSGAGGIEIVYTGLRPGEKLYEELLVDGKQRPTAHPKIFVGEERFFPWKTINKELEVLKQLVARRDTEQVREYVMNLAFNRLNCE